jgi:hypothetical protein
MADISVTPASVLASATALTSAGVAGATILAGQTLYKDTANSSVLKLADSNSTLLVSSVCGIALHGASSGQPIKYVYEDSTFTPGATLTVGQTYAQSSTAGGIAPIADLVSGDYPNVLFVAKSTTTAVLKLLAGGVVKP